tara:strand:+ start:805 stop:1431 length:627 start_codon:yes stop_codon:yes gene_type:complete
MSKIIDNILKTQKIKTIKKQMEKTNGGIVSVEDKYKLTIMTAIFLILLAISSNFLGDTLTCETKRKLSNNIYLKFVVIYCLIYFALSLSSQANNTPLHPLMITFASIFIFVFYLLFIKCNIFFVFTIFLILFLLLVLINYVYYINATKQFDDDEKKKKLKIIKLIFKILTGIMIILLIIGFIHYIRNELRCNDTQFINYIFNKTVCNE